jgi:hypothetical protein
MNRLKALGLVCALFLVGAGQGRTGTPSPAFEKLKALAGDWEGKILPNGPTANVNYRVTSAGSVVIETIMPGEPGEMVTLFHPDGDALVGTHYCAGQNQPRMRASGLSADGTELVFKFLDITNLASPDDSHMREVTFQFQDADHFTATWTYREKGKDSPMTFSYTRKK